MYRFEVYKLWLGFLEKLILVLLAAVVIPLIAGTVTLSAIAVILWFIIGVVLAAFYTILSVRAKRLAEALDAERKKT